MKRIILLPLLLPAIALFSQSVDFSSGRLYATPEFYYYIIGKVDENILVWQTNTRKRYNSNILVYNEQLQLTNTVNTGILKSFTDPQPWFFVSKNSFSVIYNYRDNHKSLSYKLAAFDGSGNLKSIETLYSDRVKKDNFLQLSYTILQSNNKKNTCFVEIGYNIKNHLLNLNYSFIDDKIVHDDLVVSVDLNKKKLASINIDNEKNLFLVFEENTDSLTNIEIIKKNFSSSLMLITDKTIKSGGFKDQAVHIVQNASGYIFFGELNDYGDKNLFVWQIDNGLNDIKDDTIVNKKLSGLLSFIPSGNNMPNTFVTWHDKVSTRQQNYFRSVYEFRKKAGYTSALSNSSDEYFAKVPLENIELFRIDSLNSILWSKIFTDSAKGKTSTNLDNSIITEVNKDMHIIYESQINNQPRFLNHMIVNANGSVFEKNFLTWDTKYKYILNQGKLIDGKTLIVPAVKGKFVEFAKLELE